MPRKLLCLIVTMWFFMVSMVTPALADRPYSPTAYAKFTVEERWFSTNFNMEIPPAYRYFPDLGEFQLFNGLYVSVTGNKFRIRDPQNKQPTVYTTTLNYYTTNKDFEWYGSWDLVPSTATIKENSQYGAFAEFHDSYRDTNVIEFIRYSGSYMIRTKVKIWDWVDLTPPVTTAVATPVEGGWNVALAATDDISGIHATFYRLDSGRIENFEGPFFIAKGTASSLTFFSVDVDNNTEKWQTIALK